MTNLSPFSEYIELRWRMATALPANRKKSTSTGSNKKVGVTSLARKSSGQGGAVDLVSQTRIKEVNKS